MEKAVKVFAASNWPYVQVGALVIIGLEMLLVIQQSGWSLAAASLLAVSASACWSIYQSVKQQSLRATTDRERLDANWQLLQLMIAVLSVLSLCIVFLRSGRCM